MREMGALGWGSVAFLAGLTIVTKGAFLWFFVGLAILLAPVGLIMGLGKSYEYFKGRRSHGSS